MNWAATRTCPGVADANIDEAGRCATREAKMRLAARRTRANRLCQKVVFAGIHGKCRPGWAALQMWATATDPARRLGTR